MRTHDEQARPDGDEISDRAVDAAWAALPSHGAPSRGDIYEALQAAAEVQAADDQAYADKLVAETGFAGFNLDGKGRLDLVLAHELAAKMTLAFKTILDAQPGAENYVEQEVVERNGGGRYVFIVCKPGGKTPHALRREAEATAAQLIDERDQAQEAADKLAEAVAELLDLEIGEHSNFNDPWLTALVGVQRAISATRPSLTPGGDL